MFIVQSEVAKAWAQDARMQLCYRYKGKPLDIEVNLCAIFYRDKARGDLGNYLAALCDVLGPEYKVIGGKRQVIYPGIVTDDRLIAGFDGSRMAVDRARPRVELTLTALG